MGLAVSVELKGSLLDRAHEIFYAEGETGVRKYVTSLILGEVEGVVRDFDGRVLTLFMEGEEHVCQKPAT